MASWSIAFLFVAFASLTGGTTHGFLLYITPTWYIILWKLTLYSIGLANLFLLLGVVQWLFDKQWNWIFVIAVIKFVCYSFWMIKSNNFVFAATDYAISLLLVITIYFWRTRTLSGKLPNYFILTLFFAVSTGVVWFQKIKLTSWFNHNDIAHILQIGVMVSMYYIMRTISEIDSV